jgi:mannosyltransferase OCH1-like enzyme
MEKSFIVYTTCIIILFFLIILVLIRYFTVKYYQKKYLTKGDKPLKYIPKKIFGIFLDKTNMDPKFIDNIEYVKGKNPHWTYTLFDNADIVEYIKLNYSAEILEYYNRINPSYAAARADFFRYLLMYREGGVYLDIKSAPEFPLDNIIHPDDEYIISEGIFSKLYKWLGYPGEYQQWHIICRPEHPYLKAVIERVIDNIKNYSVEKFGVGRNGVFKVTGPFMYTEVIDSILDRHNHRYIETNEFIGLVYNNLNNNELMILSHFGKKHYSLLREPIINEY